ncbi:hypothetical protein KPH14_011211 [Odynerus spinipes]|uniref:Uncharacterized protein n=1 Tax=Odynerus spinipes TaxID=1348599 RepID=A0AAD9R9F0_9HYME|nr:hypothetical protein KPH14_011211 [Odynerus spinipes]
MENIHELDDLDVFYTEKQLREKIYELQQKSDILEQTQKELLETRRVLYDAKSNLEKNGQISNELKMQILAAIATINRLEDEKTRTYVEHVQLKVNYEAMCNERDSLIEQTKAAKSEIVEANIKLQTAKNKISTLEMLNKNLEESLTMLKSNTLRMIATAESEIVKLKKEYQHLEKSCQIIINLNKRLQTFGLCAHNIHQRDKIEMKKLQCKLASLSIDDLYPSNCDATSHPEIQKLCRKLQALLEELKLSL